MLWLRLSPPQTCLPKPEHARGVSGVGGHSGLVAGKEAQVAGSPCSVEEMVADEVAGLGVFLVLASGGLSHLAPQPHWTN